MSQSVFMVLYYVLIALSIIFAAVVIPYSMQKLKDNVDDRLYDEIKKAVRAAQQTLKEGETKKEYVITVIKQFCNKHNIEVTDVQLNMLVEAAVYSLKHEDTVDKIKELIGLLDKVKK